MQLEPGPLPFSEEATRFNFWYGVVGASVTVP
jgi:hypothetical protein